MFLECLYSRENKGDVLTNSSVKFQGTTCMLGLQQRSTSLLSWPTLTLHKTIRPRSDMPTTVSKERLSLFKDSFNQTQVFASLFEKTIFPLIMSFLIQCNMSGRHIYCNEFPKAVGHYVYLKILIGFY